MDLELSDEQTWLSESVETLLARERSPARLWATACVDVRRARRFGRCVDATGSARSSCA